MVGISSPTELFPDVLRVAKIIRKTLPDAPVVYGGHHASALPVEVLHACEDIDIIVQGEGEGTMKELADGKDYMDVKGIYYRRGGRAVYSGDKAYIQNLDALPIPARHLLDMAFYIKPSPAAIRNLTLRTATMMTSRGCPFRCSFCVESLPFGKKHRFHSTSRVIFELDQILTHYPVEAVYFLDEGFLGQESRVSDLCESMIRHGYHKRIQWAAQVRVDSLNRDILGLMKEAGCVQLECGFETASDRLLDGIKKRTTHRKNAETVALIRSSGIRCLANIIVGLPGESEEELNRTVRFIKTSGAESVVFSKFCPHPGSVLYHELLNEGLLKKGFWKKNGPVYANLNFTAMSDRTFEGLYRKGLKKVIEPINARDRMSNCSLRQRLAQTSFQEVLCTMLHAPKRFFTFMLDWAKTQSFFSRQKKDLTNPLVKH